MTDNLIHRAIRGLKHCGRFRYEPGDEPNPLDCTLAGRVSHVFLTGMTRAIQLCRDAGEDPEYRESHYEDREKYACKVCGAVPDEDGMIEHGRGCFVASEDGGGFTFVEFDREGK